MTGEVLGSRVIVRDDRARAAARPDGVPVANTGLDASIDVLIDAS